MAHNTIFGTTAWGLLVRLPLLGDNHSSCLCAFVHPALPVRGVGVGQLASLTPLADWPNLVFLPRRYCSCSVQLRDPREGDRRGGLRDRGMARQTGHERETGQRSLTPVSTLGRAFDSGLRSPHRRIRRAPGARPRSFGNVAPLYSDAWPQAATQSILKGWRGAQH